MKRNRLDAEIKATRQSKRQARELLDTGNNRLWMILSICLWILTAGAIYLVCSGLVYAADDSVFTEQPSTIAMGLLLLSYGLMLLLALLLLVPMAGGIMLLGRYVYEGRKLETADLFTTFDTPSQYFICMRLGLYGLAHPVLAVAVAVLGCVAAPAALAELMMQMGATTVLSWVACTGVFATGLALTGLMLFICRTAHLTGAFMARGMRWRKARARTKELLARSGCGSLYYRLSFAGHAALAVATVGVSAVAYSIPLILLSNQFACDAHKSQEK